MANLKRIGGVLYRHEWDKRDDWAWAFNELASLSDEQIASLVTRQKRDRRLASRRLGASQKAR